MRPFILTLISIIAFNALGQIPEDFSHIKCGGVMPEDFRTAFSEKYQSDLEYNNTETDLSKHDAREFAVLTNYYNHALLTGGSVLYGDSVSNYANEILDKLLVNHGELKEKLRVYTIKSNHVNAYSTNQGIIFITLGLMGKVQNEAQLAYVLAHEVSHYNNHHVLESFENQKEIWAKGGNYRNMDVEERTLTAYKYSREAEFEADKEALTYYIKAGYSVREIFTGFDILLHGYLPIQEIEYSFDKLENEQFKISDYYLIDSVSDIKENEDVDDELLTHPNIQKRKKAIAKEIGDTANHENIEIYQIKSEPQFNALRTMVRFEMINTFLRQGNYVSALYHIQVMEKEFPDHNFLKKAEVMCWYGMQKMSSNQQKKVYSTGYRELEGEEQAIYFFAAKMPKRGVNVLATKFIWEQTQGMEQDSFVTILRRQSLMHLSETVKKDFLLTEYPEPDTSTKKRRRKPKKIDFLKTAMVELFKNEEFKTQYDVLFADSPEEDEEYEDYDDDEDRLSDSYVRGVTSYYGLANVNKLLFLSPRFYRIDLRKDLDQRLIASDKEQKDLQERTEKLSGLAGVELVTLDSPNPEERSTEAFNDYITIRDWLREESLYEGQNFHSFSMRTLSNIRKKYDTDYLGVNYVSHYTETNSFNGGYFLLSALTLYPFPFYLYWQLKPLHNLEYAFIVFDLNQGDVGFYDLKTFPAKYRKGVINSHLYNSFNQLNRLR